MDSLKREITQLSDKLDRLQVGRYLFEMVFDNPDFGMIACEFDVDKEMFLRVSNSVIALLGYLPAEMENRHFYEFLHPDDVQPTVDIVETIKEKGQQSGFSNRYRKKDGSYAICTWFTAGGVDDRRQLAFAEVRGMTEVCDVCKDPVIRRIRLGLDPTLRRVNE